MVKIKRIYDPPSPDDGKRILVDRLWPRGLKKENARIDEWMKEIAPSTDLRKWFGHDPEKWIEFKRRFFRELNGSRDLVKDILLTTRHETVTLVYGSREKRFNNAVALKEYLDAMKKELKKAA